MAFSFRDSIKDDWQFFDDTETVTVEDTDFGTKQKVEGVQAGQLTKQQLTMSGLLGSELATMSFSLPIENMSGFELKQGFLIVQADGSKWIVNSITISTMGTRYVAVTTKAD